MGESGLNIKFVLDDDKVVAGFTNKFGGVSKEEFGSLNLALHVGDDRNSVLKNREILRKKLNAKKLIFMDQIHSDRVEILEKENQILKPCDAVITNLKEIGLCVMVADCVPVLFIDTKKECIGVAHCGREGIIKKLASKTLNLMSEKFKTKEILVYVGPFIQGNCYEVGNLELGEFNRYKKDGKFDMKSALMDELNINLVKKIEFLDICTHCSNEYFSYRKESKTGRFAGFTMLK